MSESVFGCLQIFQTLPERSLPQGDICKPFSIYRCITLLLKYSIVFIDVSLLFEYPSRHFEVV